MNESEHSDLCPSCGGQLPGDRVKVDLHNNVLIAGGMGVRLTPREAELCSILSTHHGRHVTKEELADRIFGNNEEGTSAVRCLVGRVRAKIESCGMPILIRASYGIGYCWTIFIPPKPERVEGLTTGVVATTVAAVA